jgi:hypothetical protein
MYQILIVSKAASSVHSVVATFTSYIRAEEAFLVISERNNGDYMVSITAQRLYAMRLPGDTNDS